MGGKGWGWRSRDEAQKSGPDHHDQKSGNDNDNGIDNDYGYGNLSGGIRGK